MMVFRRYIGAGLVACVALLGLVACGGDGEDGEDGSSAAPKVNGIDPNAEVDYDTAVVHLPEDYVKTWDDHEVELVSSAAEGFFIKCVYDKSGTKLDPYPVAPEEPIRDVFFIYGPWTMPIAEKFAFVHPKTDGELTFNENVPKPDDYEEGPSGNPYENLTQEQRDEFAELCGSEPEYLKFNYVDAQSDGPGTVALGEVQDKVAADPRITTLIDEFDACLQTEGLKADRSALGYPQGVDFWTVNEDQIDMAIKTVDCKDQVDFTPRLADIIAEYQMKVIDEYGTELMAQREAWDDLVQEAKDYIAANPDYVIQE
ncbi:MAG: hypothetical protein ACTH1Z_02345 [Ancrocorticia sp.]|uniref:hypothetical protein n=1 Tax=Ancrocorticia sp. TaxID=2593684 RepID=UPI003F9177C4